MANRHMYLISLTDESVTDPKPVVKKERKKPPRPRTHESPSVDASPSKSPALAPAHASPSNDTSPSTHATPKRDKGTGDSRVTHQFFDDHLVGLPGIAQALYFNLNRYRENTSPLTVVLTWKLLAERLAVHEDTVRRTYHLLKKAGLVVKERDVYRKSGAQGMIFRVSTGASPSMSASPSVGATHKNKEVLKEQVKVSPEDEAEYLAARAALEGKRGG